MIRLRQKRMEHEMQMKHELLTVSMEREKERQIRVERENFFTGVAHELRTPLTLILAPLQELMKQCNPLDDFYKKLQVMYKNAASLHTLVDQLLYVQKIEPGWSDSSYPRLIWYSWSAMCRNRSGRGRHPFAAAVGLRGIGEPAGNGKGPYIILPGIEYHLESTLYRLTQETLYRHFLLDCPEHIHTSPS